MAEPTYDELKAQLAALQEKVKSRDRRALEFRVSEKGAVSLYGLGRFPVTLYYEQWNRLLEATPRLREFLGLLPPDHRAAFEFRNDSWFDDGVYSALRDAGAALCLSEREDNGTP